MATNRRPIESDDDDEEEEDEITDLSNPAVLKKYQDAATIANGALECAIAAATPGAKIVNVCKAGDKFILDALAKFPKIKEKGVAFPTCVSVNNVAGHFSPLSDDQSTLKLNDIAKIDLGVQIDGYIAVVAHTIVVTDGAGEVAGRKADVIAAAYHGLRTVVHMLRPGAKNHEISAALQKVAEHFKVSLLEGVLSHDMKRFVIDGNKVILQKPMPDQRAEEFAVEENEVYGIDVVMSTGPGKTRELEVKPTVFKRSVNQEYNLKFKAAQYVLGQINQNFPTFPFTLRALDEKRAKLGIFEMMQHELVDPYPVLFEARGETIAQFKTTVFVRRGAPPVAATLFPKVPRYSSIFAPRVALEPGVMADDFSNNLNQPPPVLVPVVVPETPAVSTATTSTTTSAATQSNTTTPTAAAPAPSPSKTKGKQGKNAKGKNAKGKNAKTQPQKAKENVPANSTPTPTPTQPSTETPASSTTTPTSASTTPAPATPTPTQPSTTPSPTQTPNSTPQPTPAPAATPSSTTPTPTPASESTQAAPTSTTTPTPTPTPATAAATAPAAPTSTIVTNVPEGDKPKPKNKGNKPKSNKPKNKGNKPKSNKPKSNKPKSNKPKKNKP
ncbi:proliferation-associated protein 1 [Pelomyxa schiedti]|nr:proliferation-associated protein 1 [Pelomyxa schiedti]